MELPQQIISLHKSQSNNPQTKLVLIDLKVQVYRNLHKNLWSVKYKGKIIAHLDELYLKDVSFHVQEAGRRRVIRERKKNVHAYIKGTIVIPSMVYSNLTNRISYNPYKNPWFYKIETPTEPIRKIDLVKFDDQGKVWYI